MSMPAYGVMKVTTAVTAHGVTLSCSVVLQDHFLQNISLRGNRSIPAADRSMSTSGSSTLVAVTAP
jgi:hypothetical protein